MKLLLRRTVPKLGIVGDIVDVSAGYARNYLLPQRLAVEPTETNMRALAEARRIAEQERAEERSRMLSVAERLAQVEVTISAKANQEGVLYGSVGQREIAAALNEEGHEVEPDQVMLKTPLRHLDNTQVQVRLLDDVEATVKVWIVRERGTDEEAEEEEETIETSEAETDTPVAEAPED